jgi:hypothetical protein
MSDIVFETQPDITVTVEVLPDVVLELEIPTGVIYVTGSGGGGGDITGLLSYQSAQLLTLTELRTVRRNQNIGTSPVFAYNGAGDISTITYADGSVKTFTYTSGVLTQIDHVFSDRTHRKVFSYSSGRLTSVVETII